MARPAHGAWLGRTGHAPWRRHDAALTAPASTSQRLTQRGARHAPVRCEAARSSQEAAAAAGSVVDNPEAATPRTKKPTRRKAASSPTDGTTSSAQDIAPAPATPKQRKSRKKATADADAPAPAASSSEAEEGSSAPAARRPRPPEPIDLFAKAPVGPVWQAKKQWVVFSDLHVKDSTLDTCLEVLRVVEAEARRRGAGVLFLGERPDQQHVMSCDGPRGAAMDG